MPRRQRDVLCLVRVRAPIDMPHRDVLAEVRNALFNSDPQETMPISVSPIPADRYVKRRRPPTKRERMGLLEIMEAK